MRENARRSRAGPQVIPMKMGSLSSGGSSWGLCSLRGWGCSDAHVSMASSRWRIRRSWMFALERKSTEGVRPPDEKRRLGERTSPGGKACARSRARAVGRGRPGRPWRRAGAPVEVDAPDTRRPQTRHDSTAEPPRARVAHQIRIGHPQTALGGDHDLVLWVVAECLSQQLLRDAEAAALGGVEGVHAQLTALRIASIPRASSKAPPFAAEPPGAEGDRRYLELGNAEFDPAYGLGRHHAPTSLRSANCSKTRNSTARSRRS